MCEPDLMSSMALVHSRIRRVFFVNADDEHGALLSGNVHIHSLNALNHHYRVFRLFV
jgi:tRNA-specific adenosine deaminase 3